jgi:hypothetical protein
MKDTAANLLKQAKEQEDAARHARSIGMGYLASRHDAVARRMRIAAATKRPA